MQPGLMKRHKTKKKLLENQTSQQDKTINAFSTFELIFVSCNIDPLKKTILRAKKVPHKTPTKVDFEKKFLKILSSFFVVKIITPIVDMIIPMIIILSKYSFKIINSNKAI